MRTPFLCIRPKNSLDLFLGCCALESDLRMRISDTKVILELKLADKYVDTSLA